MHKKTRSWRAKQLYCGIGLLLTLTVLSSILLVATGTDEDLSSAVNSRENSQKPLDSKPEQNPLTGAQGGVRNVVEDDPNEAWEEWEETEQTRKNPMPKRQRKIEVGMDINTIMGMAMKQEKMLFAFLKETVMTSPMAPSQIGYKLMNMLIAGGVGVKVQHVEGNQLIVTGQTIRDAHMAKDFLLTQPEIAQVVLDNLPFTPKPRAEDGGDDDDDDDEEIGQAGNIRQIGGSVEQAQHTNSDSKDVIAASTGSLSDRTPAQDQTPALEEKEYL